MNASEDATDVKSAQIPKYPKAGQAVIALVIAFVANLVVGLVLVVFLAFSILASYPLPELEELLTDPSRAEEIAMPILEAIYSPLFVTISGIVSFGIWPFVFLRKRRDRIRSILRLNLRGETILIGVLAGAAMVFVALGLEWLISQIITIDQGIVELQNRVMASNYRGWSFLIGVVVIGIVTGFCEELFFRGFVMRGFENSLKSPWSAMILTSLIFAAFHVSLISFLPIFVLAIVMSYLVVKTDSLYTSISCHATYNSILLAIMVFGWV
jgi:membrane protease YdiL (CAAX protease family)